MLSKSNNELPLISLRKLSYSLNFLSGDIPLLRIHYKEAKYITINTFMNVGFLWYFVF